MRDGPWRRGGPRDGPRPPPQHGRYGPPPDGRYGPPPDGRRFDHRGPGYRDGEPRRGRDDRFDRPFSGPPGAHRGADGRHGHRGPDRQFDRRFHGKGKGAPRRFGSAGRALAPGADLPGGERVDKDGMVYRMGDGSTKYFQDRNRKYEFTGGADALSLLEGLLRCNDRVLALGRERLEKQSNFEELLREGERLYAEKPTMKKHHGSKGTWSDAEYAHPGLQYVYLKLKSFQRFTESFALFERAAQAGVFKFLLSREEQSPLTVASLGGGPGYELLALHWFLEVYLKVGCVDRERFVDEISRARFDIRDGAARKGGAEEEEGGGAGLPSLLPWLRLVSLDLQPTWRPYVEAMGYAFHTYDLNTNEAPAESCGEEVFDLCIISNVLNYVTNEDAADLFFRLLTEGRCRCIMLNERGAEQRMCDMVERRGVVVVRLLLQGGSGRDDRQLLFLPPGTELDAEDVAKLPMSHDRLAFPNVPYEERKFAARQ